MKDFDINLARKGHPVCTRDGRPVRIVCYDVKDNDYPILALVQEGEIEFAKQYTIEGFYVKGKEVNGRNLMMAPVKHEGWVNVYSFDEKHYSTDSVIRLTKEDAISFSSGNDRLIATVKIEWEE